MFDIPVLLIVFNRPDTALQVIGAIKELRPARLYLAADGPRSEKQGEEALCQETRDTVLNEIDWDCQVFTLFRQKNLGCALGVSGAINWFFAQEEMGIILEDDCVPVPHFFHFCRELLLHYQHHEGIMQISGFNDQDNISRGKASYFFSNFPTGWGWASWRRAWQHYDFNIDQIGQEFRDHIVETAFYGNRKAAERWLRLLFYNLDSTWDYQWAYSIFRKNGLCISPNISLVKNIGFDERATHTFKPVSDQQILATSIDDEIIHPDQLLPNFNADQLTISKRYYTTLSKRVYQKSINLFT